MKPVAGLAAGFAYVEILIAVVLLALCALPAANAVRNGLNAVEIVPTRANELRCMRDLMETVLAKPYADLLAAKKGKQPTSLSVADQVNGCVERQVYIDVYEQDGSDDTAKSTALLRIDVVSSKTDFAFTTLVGP